MDKQPVETTLYSLSTGTPQPDAAATGERRDGERHMTLYRVGSILVEDRRELCLIKNISSGGMMIRAYCTVTVGTMLSVELKCGQPIAGRVSWTRDQDAGIAFDTPIDVIDILSASMEGPRPRMPRIEVSCSASVREDGQSSRIRVCDISQGGTKIECATPFAPGAQLVLTLPGLPPQPGVASWTRDGFTGIAFNRLIPLRELVDWLHGQRSMLRADS